MISKSWLPFLFALVFVPIALPCQESGTISCNTARGLYYYRNYTRKDYNNHSTNWCVLQDKRGMIYLGNNGGLMELDGVSWREIPVPNNTVRSLAMDDNGVIYVGGKNEFGFLAVNALSALEYVSLVPRLEEKHRNFSDVWQIQCTTDGVFSRTNKYLINWHAGRLTVREPGGRIRSLFACDEKLFVQVEHTGLMQMENGALTLVAGGERFAVEKLHMIVRYDAQRLLLGTRLNGMFLYDGRSVLPFPTRADAFLKEKELYYGIRLDSGEFALATRRGGLVVIDSRGEPLGLFDKSSGLLDDSVKHVFGDRRGNLWLALAEGAAKIEYASPVSVFDERRGLPGNVLSVTRHGFDKRLFAGTDRGLYALASDGRFYPAAGLQNNCYDLLSLGDSLLAATDNGVFLVREDSGKQKVCDGPALVLRRSGVNTGRVWVGTRQGLLALRRGNQQGQWMLERKFEEVNHEIRSIVEDKKGNLWLGARTAGAVKLDFPGPAVTLYAGDHAKGLPDDGVNVFFAAGHVMFATAHGIFRFDEEKGVFVPDAALGDEFAGGENGRGVFRIIEDRRKHIWIHSRSRNIQAIPRPGGGFALNKIPFYRIPIAQVNGIYPDGCNNEDIVWLASHDGLVRFDRSVRKDYCQDFSTLIRRVWVNGELIFDGCEGDAGHAVPVIDYRDRNIRFEFAAPFFEAEQATRFQCLLDGYDGDWSPWSGETRKDYTNLDPGMNTFRVRAKNVYDHPGGEAVFRFKVLPPWHRTWWAVSVYVLGFFLLVFLAVKWRSWKLVREKQKLEDVIQRRTRELKERSEEIRETNLLLEQKTRQLEEQSEKLQEIDKVKSRFFANISHEFRTPLTLIMGPLEQILSQSPLNEDLEKKARMMLRNSQRLLGLINQLLDLAKLDSGKIKPRARPGDILSFLKGVHASFEPAAGRKDIDLRLVPPGKDEEITGLFFDPVKMEEVFFNLLGNAVKFTPVGGRVSVSVSRGRAGDENFPAGYVEISVSDTGPGIPREQLADVFDRFYQADNTGEHRRDGSGIGLAIARELIELHHGTIVVESREGEESGTEFIIRLPMGSAHLLPGEIADPDAAPWEAKRKPGIYSNDPGDDEPGEERAQEPGDHGKEIILVVEDSADVREYIRGALEPLYRVAEAADGKEGVEKARELIPDLIISDIMMPGMDGYELCRTLKDDRKTSHAPVILLTAKASEESIIQGLETGADDYITKPFNTAILCARIKNLIDLRSHWQQTVSREMTFQPARMQVSAVDREFLGELQEMIDGNIGDPGLNVEELSRRLYMGRTTLYRKILALTGETPTEFIRSYRLKRGAEMLKNTSRTVLDVALEVGFSDATYFTKCFKKKFHQLPSEFREANKN
jgi:signal transduction histidine kinase/DNA-binding NarL/FixJ family response regulator